MSNIIWIILIGFVAGLIARLLLPGPNDPKGLLLTMAHHSTASGAAAKMLEGSSAR